MYETKRLKERRNAAKREHDTFQPLVDEAFQYAIPYRKSTRDTGTGEKRVDQVFDQTAIDSAFRFAGKLQQDLWPTGQQNFELEPGPIVIDQKQREGMRAQLEPISKVLTAFDDDGDWDMAFHEMALELSAGTGAMLMNSTDDPDLLWEPISVSIDELILEKGRNNKISGIFWTQKMCLRVLWDTWPEGKFSLELTERWRTKPEEEIDVNCDTVWDKQKRRWVMLIWCDKQETIIYTSMSRTCPWLTPRYMRVPGETKGRGLVMLAMPTIKTANTAKRLMLQAGAIAMLGIYTAVDDGVFNPDLAPLEPGVFWKVARNGGTLGPSVSRFPDPRLDLAGLVVKDMQSEIKATMMDQTLPPDSAAVKSATEILERVKRLAADHIGAFGRLVKEIVVPSVRRRMELAYNKGLISTEIPIDQLLVRVKVKSPLALAREAERIGKIVQWLEMVIAILTSVGAPQGVKRIAKLEELLTDVASDMGVPSKYVVTTDERAEMDKAEQQQQALLAAAAAATGAAGGMPTA
ncbi:head-tail connector protein [Mesorhizobium sp. BH1-1-5]|uniref:portal protein n=1 Tax=Mesorhizobium sp. BH1-1-5 TaxID=2876661 RepID=UPI001CCC54BB|nr:portal protein [Mesorhizobium sp. BH1-1-5]MBZ9986065.1 head-tail connector protein [Mesorhizobium sp. BH1-1-5]